MAANTVYGIEATLAYQTVPPTYQQAKKWGSGAKIYRGTYEASALDYPGTINMFKPQKGLKWTGRGFLASDALGTGATLSVGTGATKYTHTAAPALDVDFTNPTPEVAAVDKFLAATTLTSAARTELGPIAAIDAMGYEFDGETWVTVVSGTAAASGTIKLVMEFM